jgi:membrane AbrB-like protein
LPIVPIKKILLKQRLPKDVMYNKINSTSRVEKRAEAILPQNKEEYSYEDESELERSAGRNAELRLQEIRLTQWGRFLLTCAVSLIGGTLFTILHTPIPWLLGPVTATLIGAKVFKLPLWWSPAVRDTGIGIVGYSIGLTLTLDTLVQTAYQLPSMLLMTVILISFCVLVAYLFYKLTDVDFPTLMTGSIPGGLTQMVVLADEVKGVDVTIVTFMQVTRLIMITFCVPFLLFSPVYGGAEAAVAVEAVRQSSAAWSGLFPGVFIFVPICVVCAWASKKIGLPTAVMLGPLIGTAAAQIVGLKGPALPDGLLNASQFMIGTYIGLLLHPENLKNKTKTIIMAVTGGSILILGTMGLAKWLEAVHHVSPATAFLSMAPGGMDQMGIMAHEVGADLLFVSGYQLFRVLFIYFVVAGALKFGFQWYSRRQAGKAMTKAE